MWKSLAATAAFTLAFALSGCGGSEELSVELQAIDEPGPGPFTEPVGTGTPLGQAAPADNQNAPNAEGTAEEENGGEEGSDSESPSGTRDGRDEGLYGDTDADVHCDKEALVSQLNADEDKLRAWGEARDISPEEVEPTIQAMTPVLLRSDTLVTNHSYNGDGSWEPFLATLEAGSAVLVDEYGTPGARCQCGNPLTEPQLNGSPVDPEELPDPDSSEGEETYTGEPWEGYTPAETTVVTPSEERITELVATDINTGEHRHLEVADKEESEETDPSPDPSESPGVPEESPVSPDEESPQQPDGEPEGEYGSEEGEQPGQDTVPEQEPAPESDN